MAKQLSLAIKDKELDGLWRELMELPPSKRDEALQSIKRVVEEFRLREEWETTE